MVSAITCLKVRSTQADHPTLVNMLINPSTTAGLFQMDSVALTLQPILTLLIKTSMALELSVPLATPEETVPAAP
jgi:hypothetical protein